MVSIYKFMAEPLVLPPIVSESGYAEDYLQPADSPAGFVEPSLIIEESPDGIPDVILVSAPAAVGKSWLARYLSAETGNPLVDLSAFSVGSTHYAGLFAEVYGPTGYGSFVQMLQSGSATLIVDSADEALVKVGSGSFEESLRGLVRLIRGSRTGKAAAVILGRDDTIEDCSALFELEDMKVLKVRVDFFGESEARKFVRTKISVSGVRPIAEIDGFLTEFFGYVEEALGVDDFDSARDFLGYAPVLDTLAEFYQSQQNPIKLLQSLEDSEDSRHVWMILSRVITAVCQRETDKFGNNFGGNSDGKVSFAKAVYTPEYQFRLLLSDGYPIPEPAIPDDADPSWLDELLDKIDQQFKEHPFRVERYGNPTRRRIVNPLMRFTSPAFRDYVLAWGLANLDDAEVRSLVHYSSAPDFNPTPMLCRFIFQEGIHKSDIPRSASILAPIADSLASSDGNKNVRLWINQDSYGDDVFARLSGFDGDVSDVELKIVGTEELHFSRRLAYVIVEAPDARIVTGSGQAEFTIGPAADIVCDSFSSESAEVRIRSGAEFEPSRLSVGRLMGSTQRTIAPDPQALRISTSPIRFPWQRFKWDSDSHQGVLDEMYEAGTSLRRLIGWFTRPSMRRGGLQYPCTAMNTILSKNRAPQDMFDFCEEQGYMVVENPGPVYVLNLPFSVPIITAVAIGKEAPYDEFLREFIQWRSASERDS